MAGITHKPQGDILTQNKYEEADNHDLSNMDRDDLPIHSDAQHDGIVQYAVYVLYSRFLGTLTHSNPGTSYTDFHANDVSGGLILALVDYGTITFTHARLIITVGGNEAGTKKAKVTVGGTAIEVAWSGTGTPTHDSGWVSFTSPGGVGQAILQVQASSATEDIWVDQATLIFKREV